MPLRSLPAKVYRFSGVEFDTGAFQLCVDGIVRPCPARALRLLHLLCASPGRLFQRDELIAALWPERRRVSDESLGQVVFKLRTALGDDGALLVTVRGAGLRLDADVATTPSAVVAAPVVDADPADDWTDEAHMSSAQRTPAPHAEGDLPDERLRQLERMPGSIDTPPGRFPWQRFLLWAAAAVAIALGWGQWQSARHSGDDAIGRAWGFDLRRSHAARPETADLLRSALAADAAGDRATAQAMLAAIHASDSGTPLPALMLAVWRASAGDRVAAERWIAQARPRVATAADATTTAWLELAQAFSQGQNRQMSASLSVLLDRRPDAWILRHIRAQLRLQRGQPEAALEDLKRIPVTSLADRRLEDVLATRAALGDRRGAQALYARLDAAAQPVSHAAVGALLAWSAGDLATARRGFATTAALALRENRDDWAIRGNLLSAVLAFEGGEPGDARRRVSDALALAREKRETLSVIDAELMLAQMASDQREQRECSSALARAAEAAVQSGDAAWTNIVNVVALRLGHDIVDGAPTTDTDLTAQSLAVLFSARNAWHEGDIDRARNLLQHAASAPAILAEEYALLARDLHMPWTAPERPDPPSPPYFRLLGAASLARTSAASPPGQGEAPEM